MKKTFLTLLLLALCSCVVAEQSQEGGIPGTVSFDPPTGWRLADSTKLPGSVKIMVIGKGKTEFPPSMNLGIDRHEGTLKTYLAKIKEINTSQGIEWKDLGTIQTEAGTASLSQIDTTTEWGDVRLMHTILLADGQAYILTASALKEEFPLFYKDFFAAMRSLKLNRGYLEMVKVPAKQAELQKAIQKVKLDWQELAAKNKLNGAQLFEDQEVQKKIWAPFRDTLKNDFAEMGPGWREFVENKIKDEILVSGS